MGPLTQPPTSPPPATSQTQSPRLLPSSPTPERNTVSDTNDNNTFDSQNTKRNRRRARLNSENVKSENISEVQPLSAQSSDIIEAEKSLDDTTKRVSTTSSLASSSPTSSVPVSKPPPTKRSFLEREFSNFSKNLNSTDKKQTEQEKRFGTIPDSLPSGKSLDNINNSNPSAQTEKVPKSSLRKTSSTRSALSLVFDISQNQTISRSTSASSSRCDSRQGKYHKECQPVEDPNLKIENWSRIRSLRSPKTRSPRSTRPGSETSLLGRRESVTNLIFSGQSNIDGDESGLETVYWRKVQLHYTSRGSLLVNNRMATSSRGHDITRGDFNVIVAEDYSSSRQSKPITPSSSRCSTSPARSRSGFLYQDTDFDRLSKDVPAFVRHYAQKNGKMITESFILRLNYLRRRRQLGENSSTINIGNSNSGHGHSHSQNTGNNMNKRSSPTVV